MKSGSRTCTSAGTTSPSSTRWTRSSSTRRARRSSSRAQPGPFGPLRQGRQADPRGLQEEHFTLDEKQRNVTYTDEGNEFIEEKLHEAGILPAGQSLYDPESTTIVHHVNQALRAHKMLFKDQDYIVRDNEIVLIDEFTGRMMVGRRLSDGLHQAIEAKEGVAIQPENVTHGLGDLPELLPPL
jgi:hypothetical protein